MTTATDVPTVIFGEHDQRVLDQLARCAEKGVRAVLCADGHLGYSQPIGAAIAYRDHISPSGVGYDIGCGNRATRTNVRVEDVDIAAVMDEITRRISFGMGRPNSEPADHPVIDRIAAAEVPGQRKLAQLAYNQLGTVGGGNHYCDLFADDDGMLWIGVHFGSRGFGHKTASGFLAMAQGLEFGDHAKEGGMDAEPTLLEIDSEIGRAYIEAMDLAREYAYAGRDVVVEKVLEIIGAEDCYTVHANHNDAHLEEHDGEAVWVVRKGCTPAFPGQHGFVGGSMGDISVILRGKDTDTNRLALYSTVHGAGRAMSRNEARGKVRKRKVWQCADRDCSYSTPARGGEEAPARGFCPDHPDARALKRWHEEVKTKGKIDFDVVRADLAVRGIVLRGGDADEAPGAYKRLPEVLSYHGDAIDVLHTLRPVGVAMAGPGVARDD